MKTIFIPTPSEQLAKLIAVTGVLALVVVGATTASAQYTNLGYNWDFSQFAGDANATTITGYYTVDPAGVLTAATIGWQADVQNDFGSSPDGSTNGFSCAAGTQITFTGNAVALQSVNLDTWNMAWGAETIIGKRNGAQVWSYDSTGQSSWTWVAVTNGMNLAVDELDFSANWNGRWTDFIFIDASNLTPPPITSFVVSPLTVYRTVGAPVSLVWSVDPAASSVSINNGIGDVTGYTVNGVGSYAVSNAATTTYTLTVIDGTNNVSASITVPGVVLPASVGFLTFENLTGFPNDEGGPVGSNPYNWNAPAGVNINWTGWESEGGTTGVPATANQIWPVQWTQDGTNNGIINFLQSDMATPQPVFVNSFAVNIPPNISSSWGHVIINGLLGGVVKWTWTDSQAISYLNIVTAGAGIAIDEMTVQGYFYTYDNFAISLTNATLPPSITLTPTVTTNGFQCSWTSGANWANYLVMKKDTVNGLPYLVGGALTNNKGSSLSYSEAFATNEFFRVLRVP